MPWRETRVMDERARFVLAVEAGEEPVSAVCRRFGISRDKGYKWLRRWQAEGAAGLADRSRAPLSHPQAVADRLLEACLALRRQHPTWGPAKVKAALERRSPDRPWPAASTIGALFDREGLTVKRRIRRRGPPGGPLFAAAAANDVWTIDFKGWFRTGDGTRVDPLTLVDGCSRYLLRCQAGTPRHRARLAAPRRRLPRIRPAAQAALRQRPAVRDDRRRRALPARGQGDQGRGHARAHPPRQAEEERPARAAAPDAAPGYRRSAGRHPARAAAAVPEVPGRVQRGAPACRPRQRHSGRTLRALAPALDGVLRSPKPATDAVRRVKSNGQIRWRGVVVYISEALGGEPVGLDEGDDGRWAVRYGPILLGLLADRGDTLIRCRKGLWTCGQPSASPTGPQPPAATDRNIEGTVSPMSSVRSVTHVAGCALRRARQAGARGLPTDGSPDAPRPPRSRAPADNRRDAIVAPAGSSAFRCPTNSAGTCSGGDGPKCREPLAERSQPIDADIGERHPQLPRRRAVAAFGGRGANMVPGSIRRERSRTRRGRARSRGGGGGARRRRSRRRSRGRASRGGRRGRRGRRRGGGGSRRARRRASR